MSFGFVLKGCISDFRKQLLKCYFSLLLHSLLEQSFSSDEKNDEKTASKLLPKNVSILSWKPTMTPFRKSRRVRRHQLRKLYQTLLQWFLTWGKLTPGGKFQLSLGEIYWIINYSKSPIYKFLQNVITWIIRLVSYRTKHKYIRQCFVRRLMRGLMPRILVHCYEVGLRIYGTNWRCCTLDCDSELCLVTSFLFLVALYTCKRSGP